jgi:hypothetical protein
MRIAIFQRVCDSNYPALEYGVIMKEESAHYLEDSGYIRISQYVEADFVPRAVEPQDAFSALDREEQALKRYVEGARARLGEARKSLDALVPESNS